MNKYSIIIPVLNDDAFLKKVLKFIFSNNNMKHSFEVIVVDNGSECSYSFLKNFRDVKYIKQTTFLSSPYSCRNRGIEVSTGEYLIFLDVTCVPNNNWLEAFNNCLDKTSASIVAGDVIFNLSNSSTIGEFSDSLNNVDIENSVKNGHCMTANLLVKKDLFKKFGLFEEGIRSGGDVRWTKKAYQAGYNIIFCKEAFVSKEPRKTVSFLKKSWRVGKWYPIVWGNEFYKQVLKQLVKMIAPPNFYRIIKRSRKLQAKPKYYQWVGILMLSWIDQIIKSISSLYGIKNYKKIK